MMELHYLAKSTLHILLDTREWAPTGSGPQLQVGPNWKWAQTGRMLKTEVGLKPSKLFRNYSICQLWSFSVDYPPFFCCLPPLFCCLPLPQTVRLPQKKLQNATKSCAGIQKRVDQSFVFHILVVQNTHPAHPAHLLPPALNFLFGQGAMKN